MAEMNYQPDARCQALYETTQQFLDRIPMEPETLPRYLQMQGRFPQLSVNNAILMAVQYPAATRYRTLADWQTDGVTVQSGQQPTSILIPDGTYKRVNGSTATKFAVQQVYDITQTDAVSKPEQADLRQTLHAMLMRPVCPVEVIQRSGGAGGQNDKIRSMVDLRYLILRLLGAEHLDTARHVGLQNIAPGIQLGVLSFGFYLAALTQAFLPQRQRARKGKIDMRVKALGVIHRQTAAL